MNGRRVRKILLSIAFWMGIGHAESLSLASGLDRLEQRNSGILVQAQKVTTARDLHRASYGNFMPVVRLDADYKHLDREIELDLDPIRSAIIQLQSGDALALQNLSYSLKNSGAALPLASQQAILAGAKTQLEAGLPHFRETVAEQNDWEASVVAYQPLFHGGRILAAERVAAARERAAGADLSRQITDQRRDFAKLYLQASLLQASIALRNQAIAAIGHHRDRARTLVAQGMADRSAQLRAELAWAEARTALSDDSSKLESIALTLAQMADQDEPITPSEPLPPPPEILSGELGVDHNPTLTALAAQQEVAHKAVAVRNADFLPEIGAFGKYELNQDAAKAALLPCWVVGVKGTVTLFRGGADWHNRAAARSTEIELALLRKQAKSALQAQANRQFLTLKQSRTRYANLGAQAELARENHRTTALRFEQGQATSLEVVDAWLALQKAELERLASAGDAWIALNEICWATGRIDEFSTLWNGARK